MKEEWLNMNITKKKVKLASSKSEKRGNEGKNKQKNTHYEQTNASI